MPIRVEGLGAIREKLQALRNAVRVPEIFIDLPEDAENKIQWLVDGRKGDKSKGISPQAPRNILAMTPKLILEMVAAFSKALLKAVFDPTAPWKAAAQVYLTYLQNRVGFSGGDLHDRLAPLRPATVKAKGGNTRMFFDTGALFRALKSAKIRVVAR